MNKCELTNSNVLNGLHILPMIHFYRRSLVPGQKTVMLGTRFPIKRLNGKPKVCSKRSAWQNGKDGHWNNRRRKRNERS